MLLDDGADLVNLGHENILLIDGQLDLCHSQILQFHESIAEPEDLQRLEADPILYCDIPSSITVFTDGNDPSRDGDLWDAAHICKDCRHTPRLAHAEGNIFH